MRLLFTHDHKFLEYAGKYYSNGGLSTTVLQRYTKVFENVNVLSRIENIKIEPLNMTNSSVEGISFYNVPNFKSIKGIFNIFKARKIIKGKVLESDCLIARNSSISFIAIRYARKHNIPYLIEVVSCSFDSLWNHSFFGKLLAPFEFLIQKNIIKQANYVIYVTEHFLQTRYPTNGLSIHCSNVQLPFIDKEILERRIDKIKKLNKFSKIKIGTIASINVKYKGQDQIIKTLAYLKSKGYSNFEYHLVGYGDSKYLKSIAKKLNVSEQVVFVGSISHNIVYKWLDSIDLYVQPSKTEGLPRALIEAMSRALPVFGANSGGIPELIEKNYIFSKKNNNHSEIGKIILALIKNAREQSNRNFEVSKKYDSSLIEKRRENFLFTFKSQVLKGF